MWWQVHIYFLSLFIILFKYLFAFSTREQRDEVDMDPSNFCSSF